MCGRLKHASTDRILHLLELMFPELLLQGTVFALCVCVLLSIASLKETDQTLPQSPDIKSSNSANHAKISCCEGSGFQSLPIHLRQTDIIYEQFKMFLFGHEITDLLDKFS